MLPGSSRKIYKKATKLAEILKMFTNFIVFGHNLDKYQMSRLIWQHTHPRARHIDNDYHRGAYGMHLQREESEVAVVGFLIREKVAYPLQPPQQKFSFAGPSEDVGGRLSEAITRLERQGV